MSRIHVLPSHIADLIAAGEVVERPASVIKELLENAIDAGATACTVEIEHGGLTYMRVSDNGCGMDREDAKTAFLRHATSKLRTAADLEAIGTLGFRGEALAAIAAVSRVELLTCPTGETLGTALTLEAGEITSCGDAGCPEGTTLVVRDLFFNTPARQKFMRRDAAEASAVRAAVVGAALGHPEVSVKYLRDGKEELHTPGDGDLQNCIYSALGREFALGLLPVERPDERVTVRGFVTKPAAGRGNRAMEHFFVNGRPVKSAALAAALEAAYRNRSMVGKFPGCVLDIRVRLENVDVNVHPAKTEVRLFDQRAVTDAVYGAAMDALDADSPIARPKEAAQAARPREDFFRTMTAEEYRRETAGGRQLKLESPRTGWNAGGGETFRRPAPPAGMGVRPVDIPWEEPERPSRQPAADSSHGGRERGPAAPPRPAAEKPAPRREERAEIPAPEPAPAAEPAPEPKEAPPFRVAGELFSTYIVVETEGRVLLIDKHAAHERVLFDKLSASAGEPMSQTLLTPVTVTPPAEELSALLENLEALEAFGFEAEDFGGGVLVIRACPADMDPEEVPAALEEIGGELAGRGTADPAWARHRVLATVACKAAIKAGRDSHPAELRLLAEKVVSGEIQYCPHGRPVAEELTSKTKLDKLFGRTK